MNKRLTILYSTAAFLALALAAAGSSPAIAKDDSSSSGDDATATSSSNDVSNLIHELKEQGSRLSAQEKKLADQEKALEDQKTALTRERIQFEKLQTQVISITGKPIPVSGSPTQKASADESKDLKKAKPAAYSSSGTPQEVGTERKEAAKEKPPEIPAILDEGGVLTQKGKIVVTPGLEYDRSSATSVAITGFTIIPAINIGSFDVSQVNRDLITPSMDLRYGVTNRFEIEAKVPYVWRKDSTLENPVGASTAQTLTSVTGSDIGDIEFGAHYQINNGEQGWPYLIGNLRFKTATGSSPFDVPVVGNQETKLPTGSGFYALQPSITAIFPSDPVVYYGNLGYLHNFSRSFVNYGDIVPGDGFSGSMGMSLSLNDKSSFSIGYSHTMVLKTLENDVPIANSDVLQIGTVDLGYSYNLSDSTNINFTVSAGVTSDAPDVRLIFRVPMTFDLL